MEYTKDTGVEAISSRLSGRKIAVGVCGGIGAVEVVKIIREFRRRGATVTAFMTPGATRFITPLSVSWAAEGRLVQEITHEVEHLERYDWVVLVPATLNTISKCANGIADNAVTLLVATQLGMAGRVVLVPAMNLALSRHPLYADYRNRLKGWGVHFFEAEPSEGKIKVPESLVDYVCGIEGEGSSKQL